MIYPCESRALIRKAYVMIVTRSCVEAAKFAGMCFQNMRNLHVYTPVLGLFLLDFIKVKSNVSPRPSTFTYPIFEKSDF